MARHAHSPANYASDTLQVHYRHFPPHATFKCQSQTDGGKAPTHPNPTHPAPSALPSTSRSHQLRGCGWQPWTWHFPSLCFNYVWVPEGRGEDGVQLVYGERRAMGDVTHMPESIRDWSRSAVPELKRSSEQGWGWRRARGDGEEMTDIRLNVAKINKVLIMG